MAKQHQYWLVSPNVMNDRDEKAVAEWKKVIISAHAAIMGWPPSKLYGRRFKEDVRLGDVILIARRHEGQPDLVAAGVVKGEWEKTPFPRLSDRPVYRRELEPFIRFTSVQQEAKGVPFLDVLPINKAMVQLHPAEKRAHEKVCNWLESQLNLADRQEHGDHIVVKTRPKPKTYDYEAWSTRRVSEARKREAELLDDYERWLKKRGRQLSAWRHGRFECDAWEAERQNVIEAKGSVSRQDIRMAAGQLLDYAFQMKEDLGSPNKAILLPEKPEQDDVKWLDSAGIRIIWRSGRSFVDNADGQFT